MAKAASKEEIQLRKRARRRLIGAIALVVAAIVFLPMLLDTKSEEREQEIDIRIPPEDSIEEFRNESAPSRGSSTDSASTGDALTAGKSEPSARVNGTSSSLHEQSGLPAHSETGKQVEGNRAAKGETETGKLSSPSSANGGFVVQLGAFSSPAKARQQVEILASRSSGEYADSGNDLGATVYTETLKADKGSGKGEVTRVRIGPFATREQADAALAKLKLQGLDGVVSDK